MAFPTFPPLRLRRAEYYLYAEIGGGPLSRIIRSGILSETPHPSLEHTQEGIYHTIGRALTIRQGGCGFLQPVLQPGRPGHSFCRSPRHAEMLR